MTTAPLRALFVFVLALVCAGPALAVDFPPLTGRVVDQANLLNPQQEGELTARLEALERASSRQLVVATIASLQDLAIDDYGHQLARHWRIGQAGANNGVVLIIAPNEKRMRIEVGYGLEGIMTDALSSRIIRDAITPRFRAGDFAGGINAGADAIIQQLQAPPEAAEQRALAAQQAENRSRAGRGRGGGGSAFPFVILIPLLLFVVLPIFGAGLAGRRYRRGVSIWGPDRGRRGSGLGWMLAGMALSSMNRGGGSSSWGGGGGSSWGGGGGGGFSGGGGSFGGGGASGGW